ncbi:hypothetical protein PIROE2DRAFT_3189 [Piromyces sp. E2]|nr:hypothetical protein PIROE2DRAFT_3189 [Piromyces sp. E2]|eukprot:OUM68961.1 hypothetical protein PIROE2DRAFT_3189 [Piromyces sp. E2]
MLILLGGIVFICGFACLLFQYCFSYCVKNESNAFIIFFLVNVLVSYAIAVKEHSDNWDKETDNLELNTIIGFILCVIGILFPNYNIIRTLKTLISLGIENRSIGTSISLGSLLKIKYQISTAYIYSIVSIILYANILIFLTKKKYNPKKGVLETTKEMDETFNKELLEGDEDIYNEYRRVNEDKSNEIPTIPIKFIKLGKEYDEIDFESRQEIIDAMNRKNPKYGEYHMSEMGSGHVVMTPFKNLSLGIDRCECFGVLGPNGSGKTSLLNTASFTFP